MKLIPFFHQIDFYISELGKDKLKSISVADPLSSARGKETSIPEKSRWDFESVRQHQGWSNVGRSLRRVQYRLQQQER